MENELELSQKVLLSNNNINVLLEVFSRAGDHQLVSLLDSLLKILNASTAVNQRLGGDVSDQGFVSLLKNKLHHPIPHARVALLRTLIALCTKHKDPPHFLKENNLLKVVKFMASNDHSKLVKNMAVQLLKEGGKN